MGSYYINGPRVYTPSALKTTKSFLPIESFGPLRTLVEDLEVFETTTKTQPIVNTCHATRGCALLQSHPCAPPPRPAHAPAAPARAAAAPA